MPSSMTGFGQAVVNASFGKLTVEIQSVNRKYLEIFVSMPKEFGRFEQEVRKWISDAVSRGQLSVRVSLTPKESAMGKWLPDAEILKGLKKGWEKIAREVGTDSKEISLAFIMQHLPIQPKEEIARDEDLPILRRCVGEALQNLLKMKKGEGKALAQDLISRLKELGQMIGKIEKLAPDATKRMKQKLLEKMGEALKPSGEVEERLLREITLFAERVDIAEEITRFRSHLVQFKGLLKREIVGRKMDFLMQEMGREANTIGSKSMDVRISHFVVELKSELEKMREQIQNIE